MKWITPIYSDPIGWSEQAAKTRLRLFIAALFQIGMTLGGLYIFKTSNHLYALEEDKYLRFLLFIGGATPIVIASVCFPFYYLYAMHRLLRIIREK